jgi:hypothetical protein
VGTMHQHADVARSEASSGVPTYSYACRDPNGNFTIDADDTDGVAVYPYNATRTRSAPRGTGDRNTVDPSP